MLRRSITERLNPATTKERIAADLAGRELVVQQREIELQTELRIAQTGRWYTPEHLFYIMVICFRNIVVWDKVLASLMCSGAISASSSVLERYFVGSSIELKLNRLPNSRFSITRWNGHMPSPFTRIVVGVFCSVENGEISS